VTRSNCATGLGTYFELGTPDSWSCWPRVLFLSFTVLLLPGRMGVLNPRQEQLVESTICQGKSGPNSDPDYSKHLIGTSLSTDTYMIKFSWRSDRFFQRYEPNCGKMSCLAVLKNSTLKILNPDGSRGEWLTKFHRSRIRYLSQKNSRILTNFPKLKKIRKNSYKNSLNARVGVAFQQQLKNLMRFTVSC